MADFKITIDGPEEFGNLIQDWSKDLSLKPATVGEFRALVPERIVKLGAGFLNADLIEYFKAPPKSKVSIVLPDESDLGDPIPDPYPLADFYDEVYGGSPTIPDNEVFRSKRISDYVMKKCV